MKNRIKELRESHNLTLRELGEKVNMSSSRISQYETGKREPKLETWYKLADYFHVTDNYLKGYTVYLCDICHSYFTPELNTYLKPNAGRQNYEYCPYCMNKCFEKDKVITKSWAERKIHKKAVKRYENEINQAYNQLKDSVVGELAIKNLSEDRRHPLNSLNESYSDFKEQTFSAIFKNYDKFKKQKIAEFEKEETDAALHSTTGISSKARGHLR